jgi:hypothetical protein
MANCKGILLNRENTESQPATSPPIERLNRVEFQRVDSLSAGLCECMYPKA